jgi:hypothetical protein
MVIGTATATVVLAEKVGSWTEVAFIVAVPALAGVNMPALLTLPTLDGLTIQITALVKLPVPFTIGEQLDVWLVRIVAGEQAMPKDVMVGTIAIVTTALPDLVASCVEVSVIVAVPADAGVKTPALFMLPMLEGLTDQFTAWL